MWRQDRTLIPTQTNTCNKRIDIFLQLNQFKKGAQLKMLAIKQLYNRGDVQLSKATIKGYSRLQRFVSFIFRLKTSISGRKLSNAIKGSCKREFMLTGLYKREKPHVLQ